MNMALASIVYCIVGCNSGAPDKQALHVLQCDTETGAAKIVQSVKDLQGTTYFQIDKERKYLYSAIGENGKGVIVRFALDGHTIGAMTRLCELPCETPCHLSLTPDERRIAFAAYCSATCGLVGIDGRGLATYTFPDDAMGNRADRQQKAFAHQTFYPDKDTLGVVDLGCDRIRFFDLNQSSTNLIVRQTEAGTLRFDSGDGPRHAVMSADGRFMFVVDELSSTVCSYAHSNHAFERISRLSMLPADCTLKPTETKAAAIKLTADGKILMASNRGHDSIAFYDVAPDGRLTLRNIAKLAGKFPRDFELMPGEKFMVVGHKMSDEIQVYAFNREDCTLTPVGQPIKAWRPLCFKFL